MGAPRSTRASTRLRNPRHSTARTTGINRVTSPAPDGSRPRVPSRERGAPSSHLHVEAYRHHQIAELVVGERLQQPRPKRGDQLDDHLVGLDRLEAIAHELRVEADLEQLARIRRGERLAGVPEIRSL